jgi:ankyrin repeat protein
MVMYLNGRGADLSAGPESPLLAALDYPDLAVALEATQTLLANASDPNAKRKDGKTALHLAAAIAAPLSIRAMRRAAHRSTWLRAMPSS